MIYLILFLIFTVSVSFLANKQSFEKYIFPVISIILFMTLGFKTWANESVTIGLVAISIYTLFGFKKISSPAAMLGLASLLGSYLGISFAESIVMTLIFTSIDYIAQKRARTLVPLALASCALIFSSFVFSVLFVVYVLIFLEDKDTHWAIFMMLLLSLNNQIFYHFKYAQFLIPVFSLVAVVLYNHKKNNNLQIFTISYFSLLSLNEYNAVLLLCTTYFVSVSVFELLRLELKRNDFTKFKAIDLAKNMSSLINPCVIISLGLLADHGMALGLVVLVLAIMNIKRVKSFDIKAYDFYITCMISFLILITILQPYTEGFYAFGFSKKYGVSFFYKSLYLPFLLQIFFLFSGALWNYFKIDKTRFKSLLVQYEIVNSYRHRYLNESLERTFNSEIRMQPISFKPFPKAKLPFGDAWSLLSFFAVLFLAIKLVVSL
ncbi:hypothetical protein [Bacteriovorax sp. Seq25_V]|uniref:hypothetical protein n=1 Tax=Bacteriovorax sp. Seq25_V TaxID=1201288 RepID=UPI00038A19CF|nr:hypothetical protein [Bacteriovorax sp. Seq25_V]EQC43321.1 putative membrane protein [Bacteriovorax sp. Seq25_V]